MAKSKPRNLPLRHQVGQRWGNGQDNAVYRLEEDNGAPAGWVAKVNHDQTSNEKSNRPRHEDPREAAFRGAQYKKNKYEILKHFLGDHIPDSLFVLTETVEGGKKRYVELTLQRELPRISLNQLTDDQRADPALKANMADLIGRMQYMYSVLGEVNARTAHDINLDAKMDLGGISDVVKGERLDHAFNDEQIDEIITSNTSPNLLVNPENLQVYCIDFDQGQWVEGMGDAKKMAFEIDEQRQNRIAQHLGTLTNGQVIGA